MGWGEYRYYAVLCIYFFSTNTIASKIPYLDHEFNTKGYYSLAVDNRSCCVDLQAMSNDRLCLAINTDLGSELLIYSDRLSVKRIPVMCGKNFQIKKIFLDDQDKILVLGTTIFENSLAIAVARYFINGDMDRTYGIEGMSVLNVQGCIALSNAILQNDNKLVVLGSFNKDGMLINILFRLNSNGFLDETFAISGKDIFDQNISLQDLVEDSKGNIIVGGYIKEDNNTLLLMLYDQNGMLDTCLGERGLIKAKVHFDAGTVFRMHLFGDDVVVHASNGNKSNLVKYNAHYFDRAQHTLNNPIIIDLNFGFDDVILINNQYLSWKNCGENFIVSRFDSGGQIDINFGQNGIMHESIGNSCSIAKIISQDNKIIIGGQSNNHMVLARYYNYPSHHKIIITCPQNYRVKKIVTCIKGIADPLKKLAIKLNDTMLGTTYSNAFGEWSIDIGECLTNGKHTIFVAYVENEDMYFFKKNIQVAIPDFIEIFHPSKEARIEKVYTIDGRCSQINAQILLFIDGKFYRRVITNAVGIWSSDCLFPQHLGEHVITVQCLNEKGKIIASASTYFEIIKSSHYFINLIGLIKQKLNSWI